MHDKSRLRSHSRGEIRIIFRACVNIYLRTTHLEEIKITNLMHEDGQLRGLERELNDYYFAEIGKVDPNPAL